MEQNTANGKCTKKYKPLRDNQVLKYRTCVKQNKRYQHIRQMGLAISFYCYPNVIPCMYDLAKILMGALLTALLDISTALRDGDPFLIHFWCNALPNVFDGAIRAKI